MPLWTFQSSLLFGKGMCFCHGYGNEAEIVNLKTDKEQIIAQSIVSSFYQKWINPDYTNHVIPSIGISKNKIIV